MLFRLRLMRGLPSPHGHAARSFWDSAMMGSPAGRVREAPRPQVAPLGFFPSRVLPPSGLDPTFVGSPLMRLIGAASPFPVCATECQSTGDWWESEVAEAASLSAQPF
jgi:hypothetical protein